jgi:adhesin/invasin
MQDGNNQQATVGEPVAIAPSVRVTNAAGAALANVSVVFSVTAGDGAVTGGTAATDARGVATVDRWTLGTSAGQNRLRASVGSLPPVMFSATSIAGAPTTINVSAGDNQSAPSGQPVPTRPAVTVEDGHGNAVAGVNVAFTVTGGNGSVSGSPVATDASGVSSVAWVLGDPGPNTLEASIQGLGSVATFTATASAGPPATVVIVAGDGQTAPNATMLPVDPQVEVRDGNGNALSGVSVTFQVTGGGGTAPSPVITDQDGRAATSWTLGSVVGPQTLEASVTGVAAAVFSATATAGSPNGATVTSGNNQSATVGQSVPQDITVTYTDASGNGIAGLDVLFSVASGGGAVANAAHTTGADGVVTLPGHSWTLGTGAGPQTLLTTGVPGLDRIIDATATPDAAAAMTPATGDGQSAVTGTNVAVAPAVRVADQFGNPVPGVSVDFVVVQGAGSVTGSPALTDAGGIATAGSWTLGLSPGLNQLNAQAAGTPGFTFDATGTLQVASIDIDAGDGQNATVNTAVAVAPRVFVRDVNGQPAAGVPVTFSATSGGGSVTGANQTTDANGLASVGSWTLGTAPGVNTMQCQVNGQAFLVVFSATGDPDVPTTVVPVGGDGQSVTVGAAVPVPPSVRVEDQYTNVLQGVTVTFAVMQGGGSVTGASATTDGNGVATVGSWTLGMMPGPNQLQAQVSGTPGYAFMATATAGTAADVLLVAGDGQSAVSGTAVPVLPSVRVEDQFANPLQGVSVDFVVAAGGGSVTGANATTDVNGVATVGSWTLGLTPGPNQLAAQVTGTSGYTFNATGTLQVASIAIDAGDGQSATVNSAVPGPVRIIVRDVNSQPAAGVAVTFSVASGGGMVTGGSQTTGVDGLATLGSWTLGTTAGLNTLQAQVDGQAFLVVFSATGDPDVPTNVVAVAGDGQTDSVSATLMAAPSVRVEDQYTNPLQGVAVEFVVLAGGGMVTGGSATTDVAGVASAGSWTLGTTPGANQLEAQVTGTPGYTFSATATAASPATVVLAAGDGQSAVSGTAVTTAPSVRVEDQFTNPVPGVAVDFVVLQGGGSATGTPDTTDGSGVATVGSWTLGLTPGPNQLAAQVTGTSGYTFNATGTLQVASIAIDAGDGQSATVNSTVPGPVRIIVRDVNSQPAAGVPITFSVTGGGGSITGATQTTDGSGLATLGSWTLGTVAGANEVTAAVDSDPFSVPIGAMGTADVPATLTFLQGDDQNGTLTAPLATAPTVELRDQHGNATPGVSVSFTPRGGHGTVASGTVLTDGAGRAAASWTLGRVGTNLLDVADNVGQGLTGTFFAIGSNSPYTIELVFTDGGTIAQKTVFGDAAGRWQDIITADLPDVPFMGVDSVPTGACRNTSAFNGTVDDLVIWVKLEPIDGVGGVLAQGGPCWAVRNATSLPPLGSMRFDTADMAVLEADGRLLDVVVHEMGHALGIGVLWINVVPLQGGLMNSSDPACSGNPGCVDTYYPGSNSVAAFDAVGGTAYTLGNKVPVENSGIPGSADGHWRESTFLTELMTPFISPVGVANPLSEVSLALLQDYGYSVDLSLADSYTLGNPNALVVTAPGAIEMKNDIDRVPLRRVDRFGRVVGQVGPGD